MKFFPNKILIVDAVAENRKFFINSINPSSDYDFTESDNPKQMIEMAFNDNPDLIILDYHLPKARGLELLETLKASQTTADIPVIMVSHQEISSEQVVAALEAGAADVIGKPIHPIEFNARVKVALRSYGIQKALKEKAATDALTGLYNRSILETRLQSELKRGQRHNIPISAVMLDIDNFKHINDTYGHLFGDQVLKALGEILIKRARTEDMVIRYGGEEFLLLLFGADVQGSFAFAERVRLDFHSKIFHANGESIHFSLSAGLAQFVANDKQNELINKADKALYLAKRTGKNKVCIFDDATFAAK